MSKCCKEGYLNYIFAGGTWLESTYGCPVPSNAVLAGTNTDGSAVYVGRCFHDGDCLIAQIIPNKKYAYACHNGQEISKRNFEFLDHESVKWMPSSNGQLVGNELVGGTTFEGEKLYIGRGSHEGSIIVGKVHPSHGCLYIPYDGREVCLKEYETLVEL